MAEGIVRTFPGIVKPVVQFCLEHDINIIQMPCPETLTSSGGLGRKPHGKAWYESSGLRATAKDIAVGQANYMQSLAEAGNNIVAIVSVEFSPACAVTFLNKGRSIVRGTGIYVEELKKAMHDLNLQVPFVGISQRWGKKMIRDLEAVLRENQLGAESA